MLIANPKEYLKENINLYEYIVDNYPSLVKGKGLLCPFHEDENVGSFHIKNNKFKCFACSTAGDIFEFIEKKEKVSFNEALELLASKYNVKLKALTPEEKEIQKQKEIVKEINKEVTIYYHNELKQNKQALEYCYSRGLSDPIINHFKIGLAPSNDKLYKLLCDKYSKSDIENTKMFNDKGNMFYNKIIFPLVNDKGEVISFSGRIYLPHDLKNENIAKYKNGHETIIFKKSDLLFGINYAKNPIKEKDFVIITEGYMDTIKLHINGFYNSVACMSANITDNQINKLLKLTKNFVIALDNDKAGINGIYAFVNKVKELKKDNEINIKILCLPDKYKDIDLYFEDNNTKEDFQNIINKALPPAYFHVKLLINNWSFNLKNQIEISTKIKEFWKYIPYLTKKDIYFDVIEPTILSKMLFPTLKEIAKVRQESKKIFSIKEDEPKKEEKKRYKEDPNQFIEDMKENYSNNEPITIIKESLKRENNISSDVQKLNITIDTEFEVRCIFLTYQDKEILLKHSYQKLLKKNLKSNKNGQLELFINDNFDNIYSIARNIYKLKDSQLVDILKITCNEYWNYNNYYFKMLYFCLYKLFYKIVNDYIEVKSKDHLFEVLEVAIYE